MTLHCWLLKDHFSLPVFVFFQRRFLAFFANLPAAFSVALPKCFYCFILSQRMKKISAILGSNDTTSWYPLSKAEGIAICSVFRAADVFIVSGNLLTLALFTLSKKLRKRSLFLVINMAFSDLLLGILTLPVYIVITRSSYRLWNFEISRSLEI